MKRIVYKLLSSISIAISALSALFYSAFAFAASPTPKDISIIYLTKIFGTVGDVLHGSAPTVMGMLFNDLNCGVMGIATALISYTTVRVIVDTAHDGEPLGKKISHWIVARSVAGVGLLVPKASGYTMLQVGIMWMVMAGVGTADTIWHHTMEYLSNGGVIYESTFSKDGGGQISDKQIDADMVVGGNGDETAVGDDGSLDVEAGALSIFRSQVCMLALEEAIHKEQKRVGDELAADTSHIDFPLGSTKYTEAKNFAMAPIVLSSYIDPSKHTLTFPSKSSFTSFPELADLAGSCGTYIWQWAPKNEKGEHNEGTTGSDLGYADTKTVGVQAMLAMVSPMAHEVLEFNTFDTEGVKEINARLRDVLINAGVQYQSIVAKYRLAKSLDYMTRQEWDAKNEQHTADFIKEADEKGWASAGQYYYELIKTQSLAQKDVGYYHIWTDSDDLQNIPTNVKSVDGLKPAPRLQSVVLPGSENLVPNATLSALYEKYKQQKIGDHSWNINFLQNNLEKILAWTNAVHCEYINPYIIDFNKAIADEDAKDIGLNVDDDPNFKAFLNKYSASSAPMMVDFSGIASAKINIPAHLVLDPLNNYIRKVMQTWVKEVRDGGNDLTKGDNKQIQILAPIQTLYNIGNSLIANVVGCWSTITSNLASFFVGIATSTAAAQALFGSVSIFAADWALVGLKILAYIADLAWKFFEAGVLIAVPLALGITSIMFTVGMTLCFYVPFVPYMLFTFGVISWLIFVIEAMTASAVVALGLMDPRAGGGDEVFGRAEPAINLSMAVFLRPSTMLIGLLAGTMLSYVGLSLINNTFAGFISSFLDASTKLTAVDRIKFIGAIFVYNMIVVSIVVKCYECIYTIPDQIMQWVGAHTRPSSDGQLVHELRHGVTQTAGEGAGAATRTGDVFGHNLSKSYTSLSSTILAGSGRGGQGGKPGKPDSSGGGGGGGDGNDDVEGGE